MDDHGDGHPVSPTQDRQKPGRITVRAFLFGFSPISASLISPMHSPPHYGTADSAPQGARKSGEKNVIFPMGWLYNLRETKEGMREVCVEAWVCAG